MNKYITAAVIAGAISLSACNDADVASRNLSYAADMFQVERRFVFYNGITNEYIWTVEGLCSLGNDDKPREITVTCKVSPTTYKKHFFGLSNNVTYFAEQIDPVATDVYHYKVLFKPSVIVPSIDIK